MVKLTHRKWIRLKRSGNLQIKNEVNIYLNLANKNHNSECHCQEFSVEEELSGSFCRESSPLPSEPGCRCFSGQSRLSELHLGCQSPQIHILRRQAAHLGKHPAPYHLSWHTIGLYSGSAACELHYRRVCNCVDSRGLSHLCVFVCGRRGRKALMMQIPVNC